MFYVFEKKNWPCCRYNTVRCHISGITVSDGVTPSPKGGGSARPPLNSPLIVNLPSCSHLTTRAGSWSPRALRLGSDCNIDLILVRLYLFSYDCVCVKNNNNICPTCSKTTEVETLYTCNMVYYV